MLEKAKILKERYGNSLSTPFLQEILWFHRIQKSQDAELLTLEFLNVCAGHVKENKLFNKELITVKHRKDIQVRNILYNFSELESIVHSSKEEDEKWNNIETILQNKLTLPYKYTYLKERFESISVFYTTVLLLRKATLGINRKWGVKFLFPFSFKTSFVALDVRKDTFSIDRTIFTRGGEVLYMMISRAKNVDILKILMLDIFYDSTQNQRWIKLLDTLRDNENIYSDDTQLGFLSADTHEVFDQLVNDLIALLKSDIPHNDILWCILY